jgi:hypothetical protein
MTKTHPKHWNNAGKCGDGCTQHACVLWPARAGREQHAVWRQSASFVNSDGVVAHNDWLDTQFAKVLHQVVREAVVIVDNQHASHPVILAAQVPSRNLFLALH